MSEHDESQHDSPDVFFDDPGMAIAYAAVVVFAIMFAAWCFGWIQL